MFAYCCEFLREIEVLHVDICVSKWFASGQINPNVLRLAISVFSGEPWQLYIRQLLTAFTGWGPFPTLLCSHPSGIVLMVCGMVGDAVQMGSPVHRSKGSIETIASFPKRHLL